MTGWNTGGGSPRRESGALARARALACGAPDWHRVVRCVIGDPDGSTTFTYDDGKTWVLLGMVEVER